MCVADETTNGIVMPTHRRASGAEPGAGTPAPGAPHPERGAPGPRRARGGLPAPPPSPRPRKKNAPPLPPRYQRHLKALLDALFDGAASAPGPHARRRGRRLPDGRDRRQAQARRRAVAFLRWVRRHAKTESEAAAALGLPVGTLRDWERRWRRGARALRPRGRPHHAPDRTFRQQLLAYLAWFGPAVPLERLQRRWPQVPRSALLTLLTRFRRLVRRVRRARLHRLRWTRAGTVWALDFTEPARPIEGRFRYVLVVRDLGSGANLCALPVEAPTSAVVVALLTLLFLS